MDWLKTYILSFNRAFVFRNKIMTINKLKYFGRLPASKIKQKNAQEKK